jgi:hypothetical protein
MTVRQYPQHMLPFSMKAAEHIFLDHAFSPGKDLPDTPGELFIVRHKHTFVF